MRARWIKVIFRIPRIGGMITLIVKVDYKNGG